MTERHARTRQGDFPWSGPTVEERLARVEERLDGLIHRIDASARSMRFWVTSSVAAAGAVGAFLAVVLR